MRDGVFRVVVRPPREAGFLAEGEKDLGRGRDQREDPQRRCGELDLGSRIVHEPDRRGAGRPAVPPRSIRTRWPR